VTCSTEGRHYYATLLSLLGNRGRMVEHVTLYIYIYIYIYIREYLLTHSLVSDKSTVIAWAYK
jgi:hypothetical protein